MCNKCNGNCSGLGNSRVPLAKVETTTAPIFTPNVLPVATRQQGRVFTPPTPVQNNFWQDLTGAITGITGFIATNQQNKIARENQNLLAQQQFASFQQVPQQSFVQNQAPETNNGINIDTGKLIQGAALVAIIGTGVYLLKK